MHYINLPCILILVSNCKRKIIASGNLHQPFSYQLYTSKITSLLRTKKQKNSKHLCFVCVYVCVCAGTRKRIYVSWTRGSHLEQCCYQQHAWKQVHVHGFSPARHQRSLKRKILKCLHFNVTFWSYVHIYSDIYSYILRQITQLQHEHRDMC